MNCESSVIARFCTPIADQVSLRSVAAGGYFASFFVPPLEVRSFKSPPRSLIARTGNRLMSHLIAALVMSMGWSIRGRYGHCTGAMMPGALFAMFLAISSARPDWWKRTAVLGLAGAIGWAFGGQTSYGFLVGYTSSDSFIDILYGYSAFVLTGAMWGSIGAGLLGMALTLPRSQLRSFTGPLLAIGATWVTLDWTGVRAKVPDVHDTPWLEATTSLAVAALYGMVSPKARKACGFILLIGTGWCLGLVILTLLLGLHLSPPRSDSWAACLGVTVALFVYLWRTENRAALMLARYGLLAGGLGFFLGDFVQVLQRSHWGPFQYAVLQEHGGWGKMEKLFGFIMGLGVAFGVDRLAREGLESPIEDGQGYLNEFAVFFLFVPMMAWNFGQNISRWESARVFPEHMLGVSGLTWAIFGGWLLALLLLFALYRQRSRVLDFVPSSALGKGQLLFLAVLWLILGASFAGSLPHLASPGVATSEIFYIICATAASFAILMHSDGSEPLVVCNRARSDLAWKSGWRYWGSWLIVPALVICLAWISVSIAPPTTNKKFYRFPKASTPNTMNRYVHRRRSAPTRALFRVVEQTVRSTPSLAPKSNLTQ